MMFVWLKRIFRKKGVDENVSGPEPHTEELLTETESSQEKQNYKEIKEPPKKEDVERPQKSCPHCGAENDEFSHICWLCKKEI